MVWALGGPHLQPSFAREQDIIRTDSPAPVPPQPDCVSITQNPAIKRKRADVMERVQLDKLGKKILHDNLHVSEHGLLHLLQKRKDRGDWGQLEVVQSHPAWRLLNHYKHHGTPVTLADAPWTNDELQQAIARGPHKSAYEHQDFLREDMADMVDKGYWTVLPFTAVANAPGLRLSPIGVVPQTNRRHRPIVDYTFYGLNDATQPNTPDSMQFGRALERLIRRILLANPRKGKIHLIKVDLADGFYRVWLRPSDAVKLGVVFPNLPQEPPLVAIPIVLPMGWKNSPPLFCTATETIADVANQRILKHDWGPSHRLTQDANSQPPPKPPPLVYDLSAAVPTPTTRDPHLATSRRRKLAAVEVYMDDFIAAAQGRPADLQRIRDTLLHTVDDVFRPLDSIDSAARKEPISVKKLRQGDACWSTCKEVLGWLINTEDMTLTLTQRRTDRLHQLLFEAFPSHRRRARTQDWQKLLGELRSMTLAIPGAKGLFSVLQHALRSATASKRRVALNQNVHATLRDFRELYHNLQNRPTRLQELVPLTPTLHGSHDAAGHGAGGVWLPTATSVGRLIKLKTSPNGRRRKNTQTTPVVWRMRFPKDITKRLVTWANPHGDITNTDLELAGSILHQDCAAHCFDVRERTTLSRTDNMGTLYWQRKGSTTSNRQAASLLRLQALHNRYHRYIRLHDYVPGKINLEADDASRLQHLTNRQFLLHFNTLYPQTQSWQMWTPPKRLRSLVISALRNKPLPTVSWQAPPPPTIRTGAFGPTFAPVWPSTHFSKTSKIQWSPSKSSSIDTESALLHQKANPSEHALLRLPYAVLARRSLVWGPRTPATRSKEKWISVLPGKSVATRNRIRRQAA